MSSLSEIEAARADLASWHDRHNRGLSPLPFGDVNWTYDGDKHVEAVEPLPAIVMGINPGDGNGAAQPGISSSEVRWRTNCSKLTGRLPSQIVFAELVCIPTKRLIDLEAGATSLEAGIRASVRLNNAIIGYHRLRLVYQMGFLDGSLTSAVQAYGLRLITTKMRSNGEGRLLVHYKTPTDGDWLSIRHFAAPGFSGADFDTIHAYVAEIGSA